MKNLLKIRCRVFVLVALSVIWAAGAFAQSKKTVAIVDAGSSGSRLYVYEVDKAARTVDFVSSEDLGMKLSDVMTSESVRKFYGNIEKVSVSQPTDLYILATAGMRQVSNHEAVYSHLNARQSVGNYSLKKAMTISGRYEGLYAWMASNYDNISNARADSASDVLLSPLYGILEIGGASLQITFVPKTSVDADTIRHPVYGVIYSKSYLGGGVNEFGKSDNRQKVMDGMRTAKGVYGASGLLARGGVPKACLQRIPPKNLADTAKFNYVNKVLDEVKPVVATPIAVSDESWTKGAAYDIVINGREPEAFNYNAVNPN